MTDQGKARLTHTGITVSDLGRAAAFLRDVFGFAISDATRQRGSVIERMVGVPGAVIDIAFATLGENTIELICYVEPRTMRSRELRHCDTGFAHIALLVDDIDSMAETVLACGYQLFSAPQIVPAGPRKGGKNVYARGPDGIVVELQQAPPGASGSSTSFHAASKV